MSEIKKNGHQAAQKILNEVWETSKKNGQHVSQYVFRGEPDENYLRCDSSMYRKLQEGKEQTPDSKVNKNYLYDFQKEIIKKAQEYTEKKDNCIDTLAKVRHYDGFTNLIDFTSNCLIALYFACQTHKNKNGRLIMLLEKPKEKLERKESKEDYVTYTSKIKDSRSLIQSSVFVHALEGYINLNEDNIIPIEAQSKEVILNYLSKLHNISHETLFNDFDGFIKSKDNWLEAIKLFLEGVAHDEEEDLK